MFQNEIHGLIEKYSVNESLVEEVERLREENRRLKTNYWLSHSELFNCAALSRAPHPGLCPPAARICLSSTWSWDVVWICRWSSQPEARKSSVRIELKWRTPPSVALAAAWRGRTESCFIFSITASISPTGGWTPAVPPAADDDCSITDLSEVVCFIVKEQR